MNSNTNIIFILFFFISKVSSSSNTCTINYETFFQDTYPDSAYIDYIVYADESSSTISGLNGNFPHEETHLTNNTIDFTNNGVCEETRDVEIFSEQGSVIFNCPLGTDVTDCGFPSISITPDETISNNITRSFMYLPIKGNITCNSINISNTAGVRVISSLENNVCIGNSNGIGFEKDYLLGKNKNYYFQYSGISPYYSPNIIDLDSVKVKFTKDVKLTGENYKSYKYFPVSYDSDCNGVFGSIDYTGVFIHTNSTAVCVGGESGFQPNHRIQRFKTYEVEFDSSFVPDFEIPVAPPPPPPPPCSNTCTINYETYFQDTYPDSAYIGYIMYYNPPGTISGFNGNFPRKETHLTNNTIDFTSNGVCEETRDVEIYSDAQESQPVLFNCPNGTDVTDCGHVC